MTPPNQLAEGISSSSLDEAIRVLMVEDSEDYAALVRTTLEKSSAGSFQVQHAPRLDTALGQLEEQPFDAMLLDLSLPDRYGAFTIGSACSLSSHLSVIVLTGTEDDSLAMAAVKAGAQDYLVKDRLDRRKLPSTILHAIERHRRLEKMFDIHELEKRTQQGTRLANGSAVLRNSVTGIASEIVLCDRLYRYQALK